MNIHICMYIYTHVCFNGALNGMSTSYEHLRCLTLVGVCGWVFYTAYGMAVGALNYTDRYRISRIGRAI